MDLRALTEEELDALRVDVLTEQERRTNLAQIPDEIAAMAKVYRDGGGDESKLQDALTPEQIAAMTGDAGPAE